MKKICLLLFIFVLFFSFVSTTEAVPVVVINSQNWQESYLGQMYAMQKGFSSYFIVDVTQGMGLLETLNSDKYDGVILFESKGDPVIKGYENLLVSDGFDVDRRLFTDYTALQLDIIEELEINSFVLLDDTYGYGAISVSPYVFFHDMLPLFISDDNIPRMRGVINDASEVKMFGFLDRSVVDEFPQVKMLTEGADRFEQNLALVQLLQKENPQRQVVITNGEFLEKQIITSGAPVLFIGKQKAPDDVLAYLKESDFKTAVLVGNSLVLNAKNIKDATGLSIFVKFAQGRDSKQEALDLKYLPIFVPSLDIYSVNFNSLTKQLEVTFTNTGDFYTYFMSTIILENSNGVYDTLGDEEAIFVDAQGFKTVLYELPNIEEDSVANITLLFGESPTAFEFTLSKRLLVNVVDVRDTSEISIMSIAYNNRDGQFLVEMYNPGTKDVYFSLELLDIIVNGRAVTLGSESVFKLPAGKTVEAILDAELSDDDVVDNAQVLVKAYYGQREFALVKTIEQEMDVEVLSGISTNMYVLIGIVVAVLIIMFILGGKTEYECMHCGRQKRRRRRPSSCECGNEVFRKAKKK